MSGTTLTLATPECDRTELINQIIERIEHLAPDAIALECFHSLTDALTSWLSDVSQP